MALPTNASVAGRFARAVSCFAAASTLIVIGPPVSADNGGSGRDGPAPGAVWPIDPHPVIAPYDPPGCLYCAGHRGVDLGALPLQPVRAAMPGRISFAGILAGRGVLVVDDGRRRVTYEPVTASVSRGDVVRAGDLIGSVDLAGSHCFPDACLHLGLIEDATDDYMDPLSLFAADAPVRLLPLWTEEASGSPVMRVAAMLREVLDLL